ncbi:MAG TPA: cytochrome c biogenesis heme-transporting ATPase CcmA [Pyrinomonadaceae bacterium]|nr:cytochrome c biogenesis heme-transporting ATPase CcmA [Pyrinomonadaceae bacterium]
MVAPTLLEVSKLGCVRGDRRLFSGLDLSVPAGTFVQVTGPNGSGKTSLLRILCGLLAPAEGEIKWQGENIRSLGEEYFTSVTYLGHRHGIKDELSGIENLRISNALNGIETSKERARSVLERMGLGGRESLPARLLSEGQRRRVALARLLICETRLWLLDEVMTSLDKGAMALIRSLIEEHLAGGGIAIVATHQELQLATGSTMRLELAT